MMFYVLALLLVVAQAAKFEVKDKSNNTCLLLDIEGTLDLSISPGNNSAKLDFNDAKELPDSNCTLIKLDMTKSAQVWFEFSGEKDQWQVTPMSTFNVSDVFDVNDTEVVQFKAEPLDFEKTKSYLCKAPVPHVFTEQGTPSPKYNFTVTATTENFQIQSFNSSEFTNATECPQDQPTSTSTSTPTTSTGSTASPTTSTTPAEQSVNATCTDNGVTRIRMTGFFELAITYEAKDKQNKTTSLTRYIEVPATIDTANSSCVENATSETLNLGFFGNTWSIEFIIKSSSSSSLSSNKVTEYYVSNVTLNYEYDEHLPNHAAPEGQKVRVSYSDASSKYLQASSKGYYTCKANTTITLSHNNTVVKLFTRELKYKAFNDQGDAEFSGDVSECSADEDTSSVVPIAVGAALAGLVVIVLIAYLIGRKRSRKSGYESV